MAKQRQVVLGMELDEISLVDKPANAESIVKIWKRDSSEHQELDGMSGAKTFLAAIRKGLLAAVPNLEDEQIEKIDASFDEALEALGSGDDEGDDKVQKMSEMDKSKVMDDKNKKKMMMMDEEDEKEGDKKVVKKEDDGDVVISKRDWNAMQKRLDETVADLAAIRKREKISAIAKRLEDAGVDDPAGTAEMLYDLPSDKAEAIEKRLTESAERIQKSGLFEQYGSGRSGHKAGSAEAEMEVKIDKRLKDHPDETREVAYAEIYKRDADLRRRLREEGV